MELCILCLFFFYDLSYFMASFSNAPPPHTRGKKRPWWTISLYCLSAFTNMGHHCALLLSIERFYFSLILSHFSHVQSISENPKKKKKATVSVSKHMESLEFCWFCLCDWWSGLIFMHTTALSYIFNPSISSRSSRTRSQGQQSQ